MNTYLNYLVEANICLIVFLGIFWLMLKNETDFGFKRIYILGGVMFSLIFPLIKIGGGESIPSIGNVLSVYVLPEIVIGDQTQMEWGTTDSSISVWQIFTWIYLAGILFFSLRLLLQFIRLWLLIKHAKSITKFERYSIVESEILTPFSFFNYIFINRIDNLSAEDKAQIIKHEMVHVTKHHSVDIILIELVRILFWINPITHILKTVISNIHEFQADEKAVVDQDIQTYCSLLARMTLNSAGLSLANHFNKSLTLKRITMLKTVKKKMHTWKVVSIISVMIGLFVAIACQDQVMDDLNTVVQNSSAALDVPPNVQARYDELKKLHPESKYIMMELRKEGQEKLTEMEKKYGLPKSIEVFKLGETTYEETGKASIAGEASSGIEIRYNEESGDNSRTIAIIEYNDQVETLGHQTLQDGEIFVVVEESARPKDGIENFYSFITSNMKYPKVAEEKGIGGRVFVEFVVEKDGSISNLKVLKGIGHGCDDEALRVLAMSPPWIPARQRGHEVRQKMVMPIVFSGGQTSTGSIESQDQKMIIETGPVQEVNGKMFLTGQVKDESGNPIKGANVVAKGQTYGTTTDDNGKFQLMSDKKIPLVVSFVGYKSEEIVHAYEKFVY